MAKHNYNLLINDPCKQPWDLMETNGDNKYCSHCCKNVEDLTKLSDSEIIQVIEKSSGKLCGRLTSKQLNNTFYPLKPQISNTNLYKILAGLIIVSTSNNIFSSNKTSFLNIVNYTELENSSNEGYIKTNSKDSLNVVKGKITEVETKEPIGFASVYIKGTKIGAISNQDGDYEIILPDSLLNHKIILTVNFISYETTEIILNPGKLPAVKNISLIPSMITLVGEIEVIKKKKWWQRKDKIKYYRH